LCQRLTKLTLSHIKLTGDLGPAEQLTNLSLVDVALQDAAVRQLAEGLPALQQLHVSDMAAEPFLKHPACMPRITGLGSRLAPPFMQVWWQHVTSLRSLQSLDSHYGQDWPLGAMKSLSSCSQLTQLSLFSRVHGLPWLTGSESDSRDLRPPPSVQHLAFGFLYISNCQNWTTPVSDVLALGPCLSQVRGAACVGNDGYLHYSLTCPRLECLLAACCVQLSCLEIHKIGLGNEKGGAAAWIQEVGQGLHLLNTVGATRSCTER
jgi:hypothetical protein